MMDYGLAFHKLRKDKHFALKELTMDGVSESGLSRFEKGKQDLGVEHLEAILKKMNVSLSQWLATINKDSGRDNAFNTEVMKHYIQTDTAGLHQLFDQAREAFTADDSQLNFEKMVTAANFFFDLTQKGS